MPTYILYTLLAIAVCCNVVALYGIASRKYPLSLTFSLLGLVSSTPLHYGWGAYFH